MARGESHLAHSVSVTGRVCLLTLALLFTFTHIKAFPLPDIEK